MMRIKCIFLLTALLFTGGANGVDIDYDTYMGVNYKYNEYKPRGDWKSLFPKTHPGFEVYFGWRFLPNIGLELGCGGTGTKPFNTVIPNNGYLLGVTNTSGVPVSLRSKIRFKTGHADLNAFIPVPLSEAIKPEIILSVGVAAIKPSIKIFSDTVSAATRPFINQFVGMEGRSKAIFRVGLGLQSTIIKDVSIRILWRFENTAALRARNLSLTNVVPSKPETRQIFFNGHSLALGLSFKF